MTFEGAKSITVEYEDEQSEEAFNSEAAINASPER